MDTVFIQESYSRSEIFINLSLGICFILAVIAGFIIYFIFLSKRNEGKFTGFVGWLYDFLNFKKLIVESFLKVLYIIIACFMTLGGLVMLTRYFSVGLAMIILGNIITRIVYEFLLILILICKNTSDINKKLKDNSLDKNELFGSQIEASKAMANSVADETSYVCGNCGKSLKSTNEYCPNCGQKTK